MTGRPLRDITDAPLVCIGCWRTYNSHEAEYHEGLGWRCPRCMGRLRKVAKPRGGLEVDR